MKHLFRKLYFRGAPAAGLCREDFLGILELPDSLAGMRRYAGHLESSEAGDSGKREALSKRFCRGWFIGSGEEKKAFTEDLNSKRSGVAWEGGDLQYLKQAQWEWVLESELKARSKGVREINADAKGAEWKMQITRTLRLKTTASNPWIAQRLNMGHPSRITYLMRQEQG